MLFLAVIVAGVMVLDAVGELVFRMGHVVDEMVAVFIMNYDLVSGSLDWSIKMREAVSVAAYCGLDSREGSHRQNCNKLCRRKY